MNVAADAIWIEWAEADNPSAFAAARARATQLGLPLIVRPERASEKDVHLNKAQASDYRTYMTALEKANKQGGVVVVDP